MEEGQEFEPEPKEPGPEPLSKPTEEELFRVSDPSRGCKVVSRGCKVDESSKLRPVRCCCRGLQQQLGQARLRWQESFRGSLLKCVKIVSDMSITP